MATAPARRTRRGLPLLAAILAVATLWAPCPPDLRPAAMQLHSAATPEQGAAAGAGSTDGTGQDAGSVAPVGRFEDQVSVSWALVPVLVRNHGRYLDDLKRGDFRLWVDDREVPIADFESGASAPISLVFLQDLSGSMANGGKLIESRRALAYLLSKARPDDEFALASFAGDRLQVEVPFTHDEQVLAEAMELWQGYGTTALHDAVAWIPKISATGRHAKRAVVLISDGVDNASTVSPEMARRVVREAQLPVYVIGLGRESVVPEADSTYAKLLTDLAQSTGGYYFPVQPGDEVYRAAANVLEQLRRQYVLAFPTRAGDAEYRRIRVEVTKPERLTVYHRRGYRGGPPAGGPS